MVNKMLELTYGEMLLFNLVGSFTVTVDQVINGDTTLGSDTDDTITMNGLVQTFILDNDVWMQGQNSADDDQINILKVNTSDEIDFGAVLNAGPIELEEDSGAVTLVNLPVSDTPSDGDEESYTFSIDSNSVLKIKGSADGLGGADDFQVLFSDGDSSLPGISFINDEDTGFYRNGSGAIVYSSNGVGRYVISDSYISANSNSNWVLRGSQVVSETNPVVCPRGGDMNTGLGSAAADQLSLIAGGTEGIRITEADDKIQIETKGGIIRNNTRLSAATYDVLTNDDIISVGYTTTGAVTITLPTAQVVNGRTIVVKDTGGNANTNNITIDTEGSETIDGAASHVISADYGHATVYSDGSNWFVINC